MGVLLKLMAPVVPAFAEWCLEELLSDSISRNASELSAQDTEPEASSQWLKREPFSMETLQLRLVCLRQGIHFKTGRCWSMAYRGLWPSYQAHGRFSYKSWIHVV